MVKSMIMETWKSNQQRLIASMMPTMVISVCHVRINAQWPKAPAFLQTHNVSAIDASIVAQRMFENTCEGVKMANNIPGTETENSN
jgi:hypothetical protein